MESNTSVLEFCILPFFMKVEYKVLVINIAFFFLIYFTGILVNFTIITVICLDSHLHTPMFLFLSNLSVIDMCYTTVIVPKLLYILLSGKNIVSFTQCLTQMYFFILAAATEEIVLFLMAYDRYVAICHPLHYHQILNKKICMLCMMTAWICSALNSSLLTSYIQKLNFYSTSTIHQIFCDVKALIKIACSGTEMFYIILYIELLVYGICPVMCNLISYLQIIRVILRIKSKDGRRKAFSTCSSHLTVLAMYYGSIIAVYLIPPSHHYDLLEQILTVFYTTMVPMLNPLIYSLRNNEINNSLCKRLA